MIFIAFVAMGLITGALGAYSVYVLSTARHFVTDTYDRALMAVSFARAASLDFTRMDKELLRRGHVSEAERGAVDAKLDHLATSFAEDLMVIDERAVGDDERIVIEQIRALAVQWSALRAAHSSDTELEALADKMLERLDMLVELTADHSFVARRQAVTTMARFTYISIATTLLALVLSVAITLVLARRIIRPLRAAAVVANRIAEGELDTRIPAGGGDETGTLLRSMTVMQDNIRVMVEREKAQRRSAQNRLVEALESSLAAIVLVGADGRIVIANTQLSRFFPTLAPLIAPGMSFAAVFARVFELLMPAEEPGRARPPQEPSSDDLLSDGSEFRLADGRWLRVSRSRTQDNGFFLVISDFGDVKEREERLNEARRLAEEASQAKSTFLANISHELRTPLNAIIGFSEILSGEMFGKLGNPKYVGYATDIFESGRHLLTVINNVLDLTKSQAGQLQLALEMVDLRQIVESCAAIMRDQCARGELRLTVNVPAAPLSLVGDPAKLRQILLNLMSNAVKFTEPGGLVAVDAETGPGAFATLRVSDTGIGMSADDIPVALAPFGQVDSRLARRYDGTGLGLPLTKALVELHDGAIAIESECGKGTVVTVALPLGEHPASAEPAAVESAAAEASALS